MYGKTTRVFQQIVSERLETVFLLTISKNVQRGLISIFDRIHSHPGFFLIAFTSSSTALAHIRMMSENLSRSSPIPFSMVHVCLESCSFPEENTSCFTPTDEQSKKFFQKYPESIISIRPDNFASITEIQSSSGQIDPLIRPLL